MQNACKIGRFINKIKRPLITASYINARMKRGWNQKKRDDYM
jgi:hypothetical protein